MVQSISILGESIGQLSIIPDTGDGETNAELAEIVSAVTERLSGHLENLRLNEQTQTALSQTEQQAERLSMLNEMGAELSRADMLDEIIEIGVKNTASILEADRVTMAMLTPGREHLEFVSTWGDVENIQIGMIIPVESVDTFRTAVHQNKVVMAEEGDPESMGGIQSFMVTPLLGDNRVIGVINIGSYRSRAFSTQDESLMRQISSLVGAAVERQRLAELTKSALDETQRRSEELALINRVMAAVTGSLDLVENMRVIAKELMQAISVSHVRYRAHVRRSKILRSGNRIPIT